MRLLNFILIALTAFLLVSGFRCGDCLTVDCDTDYLSVQFLSKVDNSNLFENGTYQRDSLQLFTIAGNATVADYSSQLNGWKSSPNQPDPYFGLDENAVGYIFQFNSQERDTLGIIFTMSDDSECCSGIPIVTYGIFRGDTIFPDASGSLTLKK